MEKRNFPIRVSLYIEVLFIDGEMVLKIYLYMSRRHAQCMLTRHEPIDRRPRHCRQERLHRRQSFGQAERCLAARHTIGEAGRFGPGTARPFRNLAEFDIADPVFFDRWSRNRRRAMTSRERPAA